MRRVDAVRPPSGYWRSAPAPTHRSSRPRSSGHRGGPSLLAETDDLDELVGVERGTADEGAVDVGAGHDLGDVGRLDRAAVLDAHGVGQLLVVQLGELAADRPADLLRVVGAADLAGADGPHGLVGDDDRGGLLGGQVLEGGLDLAEGVRDVLARLADRLLLAHAEDGGQAVLVGGLDLGVDQLVGLAVVLAPLGVPDGDVRALELGEHGTGDLPGVGTRVVRGDVLGAVLDLQLVAVDQGLHGAQVGEGCEDRDLDGLVVLVGEGESELLDVRDGLEVVEVHLPVARHQRSAGGHGCSVLQCGEAGQACALKIFEARATAGRDVAESAFVEAEDTDGGGRVAAPDHGEALAVDERLGDGAGAVGEVGVFEDAHRAVPEDGLRVGELGGVARLALGADVEADAVRRDGVGGDGLVLGGRLGLQVGEAARDDDVAREHELDALLGGALQVLLDDRDLVLLEERGTDLVALGGEEGEDHAAADEDAVGTLQEVVDDAELVGDLGAAEDDGVGPLDVLGELLQDADLGGDEVTGVVRQELRQVVDRGVLAVHGAEAVADVDVREVREPLGEVPALGVVLAGLAGVEAQVLDDGELTGLQAVDGLVRGGAHGVLREGDGTAEQFADPLGGGQQREGGVRLALGAAEVRGDDDLGTGLDERGEGRQDGADTAVIGDDTVREGHVEVGADEDPLAGHSLRDEFVDRLHGTCRLLG
ncbi:putative phosphoglycerate kinase [Streptomyces sp. Tu6071]|nr:putative phosphoglycerate kinase [Streptomyces sp. Tu6071]